MTKRLSPPSIHTRPTLPYPARSVPREGSSLCTGHRMGDRGAGWAVSESAVWCWAVHPGPECGSPPPAHEPAAFWPAGDSRGKVFTRVYRSMRTAAGRRPEGRLQFHSLSVPLWPPPSLVCRGTEVSAINGQTEEKIRAWRRKGARCRCRSLSPPLRGRCPAGQRGVHVIEVADPPLGCHPSPPQGGRSANHRRCALSPTSGKEHGVHSSSSAEWIRDTAHPFHGFLSGMTKETGVPSSPMQGGIWRHVRLLVRG